jgi:hypothetical protein
MIWPISYNFMKEMNPGHFILHTDKGDIVVKNKSHRMPLLNLKEVEAEVALCLIQDTIKTVWNNMEGFKGCPRSTRDVGTPQMDVNSCEWYVQT